jgi:hypothetical protein
VRYGDVRAPFRVFSRVVDRRALPPRRPPLGIRVSFRVFDLPKYRPYWFCDPTLPFGLPPAVWFSLGRLPQPQLSDRCILSSSSAFLQSLDQRDLVRRPRPANTSHGLSFPSAHEAAAVHLPRALPQPVTFRLQGLATLLAACSRRSPAGLVSYRRRSWDSPFGAFPSRKVHAAFATVWTHMPFHPPVTPAARKRRAGPTGRGSWALTLPRVPGCQTGVSTLATGGSHGFRPS